jgi:hypothetical protein
MVAPHNSNKRNHEVDNYIYQLPGVAKKIDSESKPGCDQSEQQEHVVQLPSLELLEAVEENDPEHEKIHRSGTFRSPG